VRTASTDTAFRMQSIMHAGQPVGSVGVALDRSRFRRQIARDVEIGAAVAFIALITSLIGMRLLLRLLLERPLGELSAVVRRYGAGEYGHATGNLDSAELGAFAQVLDAMGGRIVEQLSALQHGNRDLEALNAVLAAAAAELEPDALLKRACVEL